MAYNLASETPRTSRTDIAAHSRTSSKMSSQSSSSLNCDKYGLPLAAMTNAAASSYASSAAAMSMQSNEKALNSPVRRETNERHKCVLYLEEDNNDIDDNDDEDGGPANDCIDGDGDTSTQSSTNGSFTSNSNLSHREKQLLKYRKHMQKRDKKQGDRKPNSSAPSSEENSCLSQNVPPQPMDQENCASGSNSSSSSSSIPSSATSHIEMISTGTQTPMTCCQMCGSEKTFVCLNCREDNATAMGTISIELDNVSDTTGYSINSCDVIRTPRNKAELLLQAIQRTPKAAKHKQEKSQRSMCGGGGGGVAAAAALEVRVAGGGAAAAESQNNNHLKLFSPNSMAMFHNSRMGNGCHECKRQKTQHNFSRSTSAAAMIEGFEEEDQAEECDDNLEDDNDGSAWQALSCGGLDTTDKVDVDDNNLSPQIMEQESYLTSTKLTPHIDRISIVRSCTPPTDECNKIQVDVESSFKTPTSSSCQPNASLPHKQTPKPNLLQISCHFNNAAAAGGDGKMWTGNEGMPSSGHHIPLHMRKGLPKVNLTPIFCNPSGNMTSPIPITCPPASDNSMSFNFDSSALSQADKTRGASSNHLTAGGGVGGLMLNNNALMDNNNIPVQKSFSAPTLPNSPSLSPRFAKAAAIYKRRSRHLSDRSDRSSLGSDEQFSDEDLESGMYSPATSPMKQRSRMAASFGRLPLLGNLEESLLQKRLVPKIEVMGYKVLLGASGGFCPTQLTIPAPAFFYELHGETLSTPYVCDVRLPRKGYSVPRSGTVQVTLLNPMGTVVRMFVIPYDMRDMPALHQTFIRQRILAEASINESTNNNNNNINVGAGDYIQSDEAASKGASSNQNNNNNNITNNNNNKYRISPSGGLHGESNLGHFISAEHMKRLRYSIHLRFQTSRSGRLLLHTDIRLLISRRTDCDTAAAHAKGVLEAPNDLVTDTLMPSNPKYSARPENQSKI